MQNTSPPEPLPGLIGLGGRGIAGGRFAPLIVFLVGCALSLPLASCKRKAVPKGAQHETREERSSESAAAAEKTKEPDEGVVVNAAWYEVPVFSLAKKRAGIDELTAAHNKLPIGTRLRVTHLDNGKSVTVRVTDRGIYDRKVKLDLCKEAAIELGMLSTGVARVRMQILPEEQHGTATPEAHTAAAQ